MGWVGVGWDVNVHDTIMMLRWSWGGVGWDVNVHVMLRILRWSWGGVGWGGMLKFMLRSWCYAQKKSCWFWSNRPTGRYSNMCCPFVYFNTDILALLAQKPSTQESWEKIQNSELLSAFSFKRPTAIYADGARAWSTAAKVLTVPCFQANRQQKEYASTIRKVLKGLWNISGKHRTIDSDWKSLECWLPKEASKKKALVTWWPTPHTWSKGSGNGCGAEQCCAAIIQRNLQPWANCSIVEVVFWTSKNRRASLLTQFQWEIHAHTLETVPI